MSIIEIKVTLQDIEPAVTRTLQVPADIRLDRLHLTLQVAMGWTNSHLYMFEAARATWGIADPDFGGDLTVVFRIVVCRRGSNVVN